MINKNIKTGGWILVVVIWVIYFGANLNESVKKIVLISSIVFSGIVLFLTFGESIYKELEKTKKEEVPKPMGNWEIKQKIEETIREYKWNNILKGNPKETRSKTVNGNTIYAFAIDLDLDEEKVIVVLNANYREKLPAIIERKKGDKSISIYDSLVDKEMNNMANNPFDEPDRIIKEVAMDVFNRPIERTEQIIQKEKKQEKKEEVV